jgi:hypothetical protein
MERRKELVIDGTAEGINGDPHTLAWQETEVRRRGTGTAAAAPAGDRTPRDAVRAGPREAGRYVCSCDGTPKSTSIPADLQLFAAGRQSRNVLWNGNMAEVAASGSRGLSSDLVERPPPGW